jgi:hypothetical protein
VRGIAGCGGWLAAICRVCGRQRSQPALQHAAMRDSAAFYAALMWIF